MKLNRKWLNEEFVDLSNVSDKEFVETLTVFGQKVETWERLDAEIKNVVVGKVLSMVRHPNSDHMWICQVDVGGDAPVQIVTGAQNVHEGDLVPAALHNSWLPGGVHITKGKLRGEVSGGMLWLLRRAGTDPELTCPACSPTAIWILNDEDARLARTSTSSSATTTPLWILRSPTTARTATASSALPGKLPPPSAGPCVTTSLWFTAPTPGIFTTIWTWTFPQRSCATATPPGWWPT